MRPSRHFSSVLRAAARRSQLLQAWCSSTAFDDALGCIQVGAGRKRRLLLSPWRRLPPCERFGDDRAARLRRPCRRAGRLHRVSSPDWPDGRGGDDLRGRRRQRAPLWESPAVCAYVAYEAAQKPEVEGEERKEHESPPVALHTQEHGDEQDPRREKGAHDDRLFDVLPRLGVDPAAALVVSRHFGPTILRRCANGSSAPHHPVAAISHPFHPSPARRSAARALPSRPTLNVCDSFGDQTRRLPVSGRHIRPVRSAVTP